MEEQKYNLVPYELVKQLIEKYEQRDVFDEASEMYDALTEQITKLKGAIEYFAKGRIE